MARPKGVKNNPADISNSYIVNKIAKSSDLTVAQITESINLYTSFIQNYLKSSICPEDVKITIPNLGKLKFKKKIGLKAGSTYKSPIDFGATKDENGKPVMEVVKVTEDRPDYLRLWFEVSPTLQEEIRNITEERWRKNNGKR